MKPRHLISLVASLILLLALGAPVLAQAEVEDEPPHVQVSEQGVVDGRVNIVRAIAPGPAWVVIHADADGRPGPVIGHAALEEGENLDVVVEVDVDAVTPLLHAMIHVDEGEVGVYEFPGADMPLTLDDDIVMAMFSAAPPAEPTPAAEEEAEAAASTEAPGAEAEEAEPTAEPEEEAEAEATPEAAEEAEATPAVEEEAEAETMAAQEATPEPEEEAEPTPVAEEEDDAAEATPEAEEEAEAEPAATPVAEEEAEAEAAAEPTPAAEEEAEAEATPAAEEEADDAEPTPAAEEEPAPAPDAGAKGGAPDDLPSTGAGTPLAMILGTIAAVVSALGGSVLFTRRRRS